MRLRNRSVGRGAEAEVVVLQPLGAVGVALDFKLQVFGAAAERVVGDALQAAAQAHVVQMLAALERRLADGGDAVGNGQLPQVRAALEAVVADGFQ